MAAPPYALSDFRTALADYGFGNASPTRLNECINRAYLDMCSTDAWPFLGSDNAALVTVAGAVDVTLPADVNSIQAITNETTGWTLQWMRLDDMRKRYAGPSISGQPSYYAIENGSPPFVIRLWPVPDGVYSLNLLYSKQAAALVLDADTPVIPFQHQYAIIYGALSHLYFMEDELDMSNQAQAMFQQKLVQMRDDVLELQDDRPDRVADIMSDDDYYYYGW